MLAEIVEICDFLPNLDHIDIGVGIFRFRGNPSLRRVGRSVYLAGASPRRLRLYAPVAPQVEVSPNHAWK